jgi:hypothetical protein
MVCSPNLMVDREVLIQTLPTRSGVNFFLMS